MRVNQSCLTIGIVIIGMSLSTVGWASATLSVELLEQVEQLQQEVQNLRGIVEEQEHEIKLLNKRQEQLFADLDQRVTALSGPTAQLQAGDANVQGLTSVRKNKVDLNEGDRYQVAYDLMKKKLYNDASLSFQDFLWQYPDGKYAANANYWLGEIYFIQWEQNKKNQLPLEKAIEYFSAVVEKYKDHNKAIDSLLKLGLIELDKENWGAAKNYFIKVKKQSPKSSSANIASMQLQRLDREGKV